MANPVRIRAVSHHAKSMRGTMSVKARLVHGRLS